MNEDTKDFVIKTSVIMICALVVLFFAKIWIVDPLVKEKTSIMLYEKPAYSGKAICPDKYKKKERVNIDWKDADKYIGRYVITKGKIVSSYKNEKVCFLNSNFLFLL